MLETVQRVYHETEQVFNKTYAQRSKLSELAGLGVEDYQRLHTAPLMPINARVITKNFLQDISEYQSYFVKWGKKHPHLPRYGLALVNQDGSIKQDDPVNGSLYEWNERNPDNPVFESDCQVKTPIFYLPSLNSVRTMDINWCRSNILKWERGAEFLPHIDTFMPSPWIRLWGCSDADSIELTFYDKSGSIVPHCPIESGRIYIIDTFLVHTAKCVGDTCYQYFLSALPDAHKYLHERKIHPTS